jgi:hypothetical protein
MADELDAIVQRIAVEGTGEMGAAFEEVARLGEAAFERISKAAEGVGGIGMMTLGISGLVIAAAAAAYEIGKFAVTQAEAGAQTVALAEATGMTTGEIKGLGDMFAKAGMNAQQYHRMLEQSVMQLANATARVNREQALSGSVSQEQDEKIVEGKLHITDAMTTLQFASAEFSQKLQSDAIAVGEAWMKLKFESSDLASQASNDMLSVAGANIGVQEAELNLKRLRTQQGLAQYQPRPPNQPMEMESIKTTQDRLNMDKAELAVQQAKQRELDAQTKQQKDIAQAPFTRARDQLTLDQARTREGKDSQSTELERATLEVAKARTANEKQILEIDIERARSIKEIMVGLQEGKVSKFAGPQDVAKGMEATAIMQGGDVFKNLQYVIAEAFQKAAEARKSGDAGAMTKGDEEAILRQLREGGMMRAGSGMSISRLASEYEKGPEALTGQLKSRKDISQDEIDANQGVIDKSHELAIGFQELKESVGSLISFIATQKGNTPGSQDYAAPGPGGMAEGGLVTGPGTGTSDSINARLSHGEHVTKASAVQFWGTDFMDAINNMRLPGFAEGGLFGAGVSLPGSFGEGALPGGMGTVNLSIDGQAFALRAPVDTMRDLSHYAIERQTASTGRKPSWVR